MLFASAPWACRYSARDRKSLQALMAEMFKPLLVEQVSMFASTEVLPRSSTVNVAEVLSLDFTAILQRAGEYGQGRSDQLTR